MPPTKPINFKVSAPGKIILHGEHSVVYNKLALAASLDLRTHVEFAQIEPAQHIELDLINFNTKIAFKIAHIRDLLTKPLPLIKENPHAIYTEPELIDHSKLLGIIKEFLAKNYKFTEQIEVSLVAFIYLIYGILGGAHIEIQPFSLSIRTDLTIGAGTGSSASYLVALSATLINLIKLQQSPLNNRDFDDIDLDLISRWSYCAERIIHGTPSGIDNTICTYGSMIEFRKTADLKIVKFDKQLPLLLINTRVQRNTRLLVDRVANLLKNHPKVVEKILESMDEIAQQAAIYLAEINKCQQDDEIDRNYEELMELSSINHNLLRALNVSHPKLDQICSILSDFDLCGKLTGAGGGGYAICLIPKRSNDPNKIQQIIDKLASIDCDAIYTNLGGAGVRIDS